MTILGSTNFEGGVDTAVLTTAAVGSDGVSVNTNKAVFAAGAAMHGTLGASFLSSSAVIYCYWNTTSLGATRTALYGRFYLNISAIPVGGAEGIVRAFSNAGSTQVWRIAIGSTGKVVIRNAGNTVVYTGTTTVNIASYCRIEFFADQAAGTLQTWLYNSPDAPLGSHTETSGVITSTFGAVMQQINIGPQDLLTGSVTTAAMMDDLALGDVTGGQIGPAVSVVSDTFAATATGSASLTPLVTESATLTSVAAGSAAITGTVTRTSTFSAIGLGSAVLPGQVIRSGIITSIGSGSAALDGQASISSTVTAAGAGSVALTAAHEVPSTFTPTAQGSVVIVAIASATVAAIGTGSVAGFLGFAGHLLRQNFSTNPGFENNTLDWSASGGGMVISKDGTHVSQGSASLKVTFPDGWNGVGSPPRASHVMTGFTPGVDYVAHAEIWVPNLMPNVVLSFTGTITEGTSLVRDTFVRVQATATAGSSTLTLSFYPSGALNPGDSFWVDAVVVEAGTDYQHFTPPAYFDGDSAGAMWAATPGNSQSLLAGVPSTFAAFGSGSSSISAVNITEPAVLTPQGVGGSVLLGVDTTSDTLAGIGTAGVSFTPSVVHPSVVSASGSGSAALTSAITRLGLVAGLGQGLVAFTPSVIKTVTLSPAGVGTLTFVVSHVVTTSIAALGTASVILAGSSFTPTSHIDHVFTVRHGATPTILAHEVIHTPTGQAGITAKVAHTVSLAGTGRLTLQTTQGGHAATNELSRAVRVTHVSTISSTIYSRTAAGFFLWDGVNMIPVDGPYLWTGQELIPMTFRVRQ